MFKVFVLDFKIRRLSMAQIFLKVRNKQQALFSTFGCSVSLGCCALKQWRWRAAGLSHPRRCTRPWTSPAGWTAPSCWGPGPPCPYSPVCTGPSGCLSPQCHCVPARSRVWGYALPRRLAQDRDNQHWSPHFNQESVHPGQHWPYGPSIFLLLSFCTDFPMKEIRERGLKEPAFKIQREAVSKHPRSLLTSSCHANWCPNGMDEYHMKMHCVR